MSSLTQAFSLALTGMRTSTNLIALTANNISNANTAGYTAKSATVTTVEYGTEFGGSTISGYTRSTDQALTLNLVEATTEEGYFSAQKSYMQQVQSILDSTSDNPDLSDQMSQFSAAWKQYAAEPESNIQKQNLVTTGNNLAKTINSIATKVNQLTSQVNNDIATSVTDLNETLKQIQDINRKIQSSTTSGQQTVNLQDNRDQLVYKVAQYMDITIQQRSNGQIALYTPSGKLLVDGGIGAETFSFNGTTVLDSSGNDVRTALIGGSLEAQFNFIDTSASAASSNVAGVGVIAKLNAQLSTLVTGLTSGLFDTAYGAAVTDSLAGTQNGQTLDAHFFTASGLPLDPATFQVNANILAGTSGLPETNTQDIADSLTNTANYSASGLSATNVTYEELTTAILSNFQQTANSIIDQNDTVTTQKSYYTETLANRTGVNIDTELSNLITYQNSYAAAAHIISTVNQMLTSLMQLVS
ncbi:MAG: flagellar hook-associated protein FlgK [Bdellovibrionales bacterium]